jgi:hypothetical protein
MSMASSNNWSKVLSGVRLVTVIVASAATPIRSDDSKMTAFTGRLQHSKKVFFGCRKTETNKKLVYMTLQIYI